MHKNQKNSRQDKWDELADVSFYKNIRQKSSPNIPTVKSENKNFTTNLHENDFWNNPYEWTFNHFGNRQDNSVVWKSSLVKVIFN